jgi:predicted DNA-binding transcriptional regulator AlpA
MPFETSEAASARREAKAARARELANRQRELDDAVRARLLLTLSAQHIRGLDELAALLRCSDKMAGEIAARLDFPRPRSIGDRIRLWRTDEVLQWIDRQQGGQS